MVNTRKSGPFQKLPFGRNPATHKTNYYSRVRNIAKTIKDWISNEDTKNYWSKTMLGKGYGFRHGQFSKGYPTRKYTNPAILTTHTTERNQARALQSAVRFTNSRIEDLQHILPQWSEGKILKYAEEVLIPEGIIHQLTINSIMSHLKANEI